MKKLIPYEYNIPDCHEEDDWKQLHSVTPEMVAEEAAEEYYSDDPCDPDNFELEVKVKSHDGRIDTFIVTASVQIDFNAREVGVGGP